MFTDVAHSSSSIVSLPLFTFTNVNLGTKDDSGVKNACYSCTGPGFDCQHLDCQSQLPVTQVPTNPSTSSGFCGHQKHMWFIYIQKNKHKT